MPIAPHELAEVCINSSNHAHFGSEIVRNPRFPFRSVHELRQSCTLRQEYGCDGLTSIYCKALTPPSIAANSFKLNSYLKIYVPTESVDAYKAATGWKEYSSYIYGYDFE